MKEPNVYIIEVKGQVYPEGFPEAEKVLGKFWITKELVENIVSERLLTEVIGEKVLEFIKGEK